MAFFQAKTTTISAVQWFKPGDHAAVRIDPASGNVGVHGAQGYAKVNPGDWIITEPRGDGYYPCNPEVFAAKYDPIA